MDRWSDSARRVGDLIDGAATASAKARALKGQTDLDMREQIAYLNEAVALQVEASAEILDLLVKVRGLCVEIVDVQKSLAQAQEDFIEPVGQLAVSSVPWYRRAIARAELRGYMARGKRPKPQDGSGRGDQRDSADGR